MGPPRAKEVDTFAPGNGEQPWSERIFHVESSERLEGANKSILGDFFGVSLITAGLENKAINSLFIQKNHLLKCQDGPGHRVSNDLNFAGQSLFLLLCSHRR